MANKSKYNASNIKILEGLEPVRIRPGLFIGDTGKKGLHHLLIELVDNSTDEAMCGYCDKIDIVLEEDGETISVEDNGRGIPVEIHPKKKESALEIVFTVLHAGGKFDGSGYEASGGLHGVGASCVNALSDKLEVEVNRDGGLYFQSYSRGVPKAKVKKIKDLTSRDKKNGTKVRFHADSEIFKESVKFDEIFILKKLREISFLNKGLTINFLNEQKKTKETFLASGGISDYIKYLTEAKTGHYPNTPIYGETIVPLITRQGNVTIQIALNYTAEDDETILTFANNINTNDGGTHLSGFKTALTRVVNKFARSLGNIKEKENGFSGEDIREGLTAIISVRLPQPEFVGQTKNKLGTVEIEGIVTTTVSGMLNDYFDKNTAVIKKIIERAKTAQEARDASKKAVSLIKRKSFLGNNGRLPGKLADCKSNKVEECELFLVEGDSAGGGCEDGRDPKTQAVLPLRGKIINAEKTDIGSLLNNKEIQSIILAIGAGFKDDFNIEKIRYNKVVIMCLSGETKVRTLNGQHNKIKDLYKYNKKVWLYSRYGDKIIPYLADPPIKTTKTKEWVRLTLSDGEKIECTKEHLFMINNPDIDDERIVWKEQGSGFTIPYIKAMDLNEHDSLCHIIFTYDSQKYAKYESFKFNYGRKCFTHREVWKCFATKEDLCKYDTGKYDLHHIDKNQLNNEPLNLEMLTTCEHLKKHYDGKKHSKKLKKLHEKMVYKGTSFFNIYNKTEEHRENIKNHYKKGTYDNSKGLFFKVFNGSENHKECLKKNWDVGGVYRSETYLKKLREGLRKKYLNQDLVKKISNNAKNQWENKESRLKITTGKGIRILREIVKEDISIDKINSDLFNSKRKCKNDPCYETFLNNFSSKEEMIRYFLREEKLNLNIVKKEIIVSKKTKQFYCFNLPKVGNFALKNGLISSNCDADIDGNHIASLLISFFYKYMRDLVLNGHIYLAQPPLYKVEYGNNKIYCMNDFELNEILKKSKKSKVTRFKGLGEMNAKELAETTMDIKKRTLIQLKSPDAGESEKLLSILMGNNPQLRKKHIIETINRRNQKI